MNALTVTLVTLALLGLGVGFAPPAAASDGCGSPPSTLICPPGAIPWPSGNHGCQGPFTCTYIISLPW